MNPFRPTQVLACLGIAFAAIAHGGAAERAAAPRQRQDTEGQRARKKVEWVFSLLPKSMQKNPVLDMTVFTEMTVEGRAREPASPDHPVYYESHAAGYRHFGEGAENRRLPEHVELEAALTTSLESAGYRRAERPEHPPQLALILHWGSHTRLDPETAEIDPNASLRNLYARAALVGGEKFANDLLHAYVERDDLITGAGSLLPEAMEFADPVRLLEESSDTLRYLVQQANEDVYFVVASAYDYAAMADNKPALLWRTRLTVNTLGVSMRQSLPPLIVNASPFFGHETPQAVPVSRRGVSDGTVEVGTPTVVEVVEPAPPADNQDSAPVSALPANSPP